MECFRNSRFPSKDGYPFLFHSSGVGLLNPLIVKNERKFNAVLPGFPVNLKNKKSLNFLRNFFVD